MKRIVMIASVAVIGWFSMTWYVANMVEREISATVAGHSLPELTINLIDYQRRLMSASVVTHVTVKGDEKAAFSFKIMSDIHHYPYQAIIKSTIELDDEVMAKRAQSYFGSKRWIYSQEKINLFSQLSGQLTILAGKYESGSEYLESQPVFSNYQLDLESKIGKVEVNWAGLVASANAIRANVESLQLAYHFGGAPAQDDYQLKVAKIAWKENGYPIFASDIYLKGRNQQGVKEQTLDTRNVLTIGRYQRGESKPLLFINNQLSLALNGLYQPALELLNQGSDDAQEIESALIELFSRGAQLTLSTLRSETPWGEVDGMLDLTLSQGASLMNVLVNPYTLLDYVTGDISLVLPNTLLQEPDFSEVLQMGIMTGFLSEEGEALSIKSSFYQGELIVNGRVIPL